jgi:putative transcriptional regulator
LTIRELRAKTGLTQAEFAKKFKINLRTLQSYESGARNTPQEIIYMVEKIINLEDKMSSSQSNEN